MMNHINWWQTAVIYQIYPRSFQDSTGNGVGDLQGIIDRLDYLNDGTPSSLGVDAIWLSPFFKSPMKDFGYDVADYQDVDPLFGDLETFDRLVSEAHKRNIKIIIDYVPNHTSDEHAWFVTSRSSRTNPKRDWYIWKDGRENGRLPNNWGSIFGGPAWTWDETTEQYYFHQFDPGQPDLNWRHPDVRAAMLDVLRFWLKRGVDGFRMDVVYMIWKHPEMPDQPLIPNASGRGADDIMGRQEQIYAWAYDGVHDLMKSLRATIDEFPDKVMIGEIWLPLEERMRYYGEGQNDEFHMPFNFDLINDGILPNPTEWKASRFKELVEGYETAVPDYGWPNYVLGNHDVPRLASRLGSQARARVAAMMLLTLRGTPTLYMGEEIGMVNGNITPEQIQDPQGHRLGVENSRDVCRTPLQWSNQAQAGFSSGATWLPINPDFQEKNVSAQSADPTSILTLYRMLIRLRKEKHALSAGSYQSVPAHENCFCYLRQDGEERVLIALNFSSEPIMLSIPYEGQILLSTTLNRKESISKSILLAGDEGVVMQIAEELP